jgi:hypothetical protein
MAARAVTSEVLDPTARVRSFIDGEPAIVMRSYTARGPVAMAMFAAEAPIFEQFGYITTSHSWIPNEWGPGWLAIALVLVPLLIGLVILLIMAAVKPAGTLIVIYRHEAVLPEHP